ncbi:hypothetical protein CBL_07439 [Carabus blaptoides fortunei]
MASDPSVNPKRDGSQISIHTQTSDSNQKLFDARAVIGFLCTCGSNFPVGSFPCFLLRFWLLLSKTLDEAKRTYPQFPISYSRSPRGSFMSKARIYTNMDVDSSNIHGLESRLHWITVSKYDDLLSTDTESNAAGEKLIFRKIINNIKFRNVEYFFTNFSWVLKLLITNPFLPT